MLFNQSDLKIEIQQLQASLGAKRTAFDKSMKSDMPMPELKNLFTEIRQLEKRLELCFEESNMQKGF